MMLGGRNVDFGGFGAVLGKREDDSQISGAQ